MVGKFFMGHVWSSFDAIVEERMDGTNSIPLPATIVFNCRFHPY